LSDIEEIVNEAKKPGKFNIVDVVKDRGYPKDEINVFIDENVAFRIAEINEAINSISNQMDSAGADKKALDKLLKQHEEILNARQKLLDEMSEAKYVFHLTGISEGSRQDLFDKAVKKFPIKTVTKMNQVTGEMEDKEVENVERDRYFTSLLWEAGISRIVSPDGEEQEGITFEEADELRRILPLASLTTITEGLEKMRAATALFMMSVNEDFLAKS
jgi:hypothetical protein